MRTCPKCGVNGRAIEPETLAAQVVKHRLGPIRDHGGWHLCKSKTCEVVYFREEELVVIGETLAVPFHKSEDPDRYVCFCFQHTVAQIKADANAHGESELRASIKTACKAGRDDCKRKNPQGRCCLGNVGSVIKDSAVEPSDGCCGSDGL